MFFFDPSASVMVGFSTQILSNRIFDVNKIVKRFNIRTHEAMLFKKLFHKDLRIVTHSALLDKTLFLPRLGFFGQF